MNRITPFLLAVLLAGPVVAEETIAHASAGSLKTALTQAAAAFTKATGIRVEQTWGPSGVLQKEIEAGAKIDVFTSANMEHPQALAASGKMGPVVLFARNELCAFAMPKAGVAADGGDLVARMLDPAVKLGTSTPKADPAGDYALQVFAKAEAVKPGAKAALEAKALQLTGGPTSAQPPAGRNVYAWVLSSGQADLFLAYCTNRKAIAKEVPEAQAFALPASLAVRADYGLSVAPGASVAAHRFALWLLSPEGQTILAEAGFAAPTLPGATKP